MRDAVAESACRRIADMGMPINVEDSARAGVAVGCTNDNNWFKPQAVVYAKDCPSWDTTSDEVPNFDAMLPPV